MKKKKKRYLKTSKAVLSASTAILVVSSVASSSTSAAQVNEFRIVSDKNYVQAGDTLKVSVDLLSGDIGTAGFTFDLHYDKSKVSLNIPGDDGFASDNDFTVMSSYSTDKGIIRVAGAELSGGNVTKDSTVLTASFTVLDGAQGDIGYWIDVDADVAFDGEDYFNAACSAPSYYSPHNVKIPDIRSNTSNSDASVQDKVTYDFNEDVTLKYNIDTLPDDDITPVTVTQTAEIEAAVSEDPVVVVIDTPEETVTSEADNSVSGAINETSSDAEQNYNSTNKNSSDKVSSSAGNAIQNNIITRSDGQYSFNISDYVNDDTGVYDIKIKVSSTGYVDGGIGMMNNSGSWDQSYCQTMFGDDTWIFENVRPSECWDQVFVQIYSLQDGAQFTVDDIEFIRGGYNSDVTVSSADNSENSSGEISKTSQISLFSSVEQDSSDLQGKSDESSHNDETTNKSDDSSSVNNDNIDPEADKGSVPENIKETKSSTDINEIKTKEADLPNTLVKDEKPAEKETVTSTGDVNKIIETVKNEKAQAASNSNPKTGTGKHSRTFNPIRAAALLVIVYSLFAMIYNKTFTERKNR